MNLFKLLFKSRDAPQNQLNSGVSFFFGGSTSGKTVNERTALQTSAVYACVRILAETIASLPLHIYKHTDIGKEKAIDHPLYFLLHAEPNPEMTSFVFRETLMSHLLLYGNAYVQIIRDGRNNVIALYPLMPDKMIVDRGKNGELFYTYRKDTGEVILRKDDVLHIIGLGYDGLVGYSPVAMAKNAIGMSIACEEYGAKFYANDARPSVVLEHPSVLKDAKKLRNSWSNAYGGSGNSHRVAILEEGMTLKTISIPPEQSQFLQSRRYQTEEICRIFRVPPHLVADLEKATFSNIEHQSISFVVHTIRPWLVRIEQAMNKALFSPDEKKQYYVSLVADGLLRGDYSSRMSGYATGIQNGFMSPNDVRALENLNSIPDGDKYMVNGNMLPLEMAGAAYLDKLKKEESNI